MAAKENDACSESSAVSTSGLEYGEDDSLSARNEMMVNNKWLSDVTFIVGPERRRIYAHKLRLVTASKYFYILFFGNFVEAQLDEIELKDEDPEMFLTILRMIYGAPVDIDLDNIRAVYDRIKMYVLPESCHKPLIDCLKNLILEDTVMQILQENVYFNYKLVNEMCLQHIRDDPLHYFKTDDFTGISKECMLKILGLQRINCTNEQLRLVLDKWRAANPESDADALLSALYGTLRTYLCKKMSFIPNQIQHVYSTENSFAFEILDNPVALHGISVYLKWPFVSTDVSTRLVLKDTRSGRDLTDVNIIGRGEPCIEVVDLMFEKLVLKKRTKQDFKLSCIPRNRLIFCISYEKVDHPNVLIDCSAESGYIPAIAHLWIS